MILLAAIAFRLIAVPVSPDYAYRMTDEMIIECAALWLTIIWTAPGSIGERLARRRTRSRF